MYRGIYIWDRFDGTIDLIDKNIKGVHENSKLRQTSNFFSLLFFVLGHMPVLKNYSYYDFSSLRWHISPLSRRSLYSPATLATLIEFSCRRRLDTFRFIFSARYRAFPFVRRPSTSSLSFRFQSFPPPPPPEGEGSVEWKRPSYINSVAKCHDNNDLTAVRSSVFYRRCSCSRFFVKIRSSDAGITISLPSHRNDPDFRPFLPT